MYSNNDPKDLGCLTIMEQRYNESMTMYINSLKHKLKKLEKWEYEKNLYKSKLENIKNKNIILHNQLNHVRSKFWINRLLDALFCRNNQIGIEIDVEEDRWSDLSLKDNDEYRLSYTQKNGNVKLLNKDIYCDKDKEEDYYSFRNSSSSHLGSMIKSSIEDYLHDTYE